MTDFLERRRHGWFPAFYDTGGTGSNYPAAVVSGENTGINQAFQPFPYPNTTGAANNAYSGIAGDTNPAGQSALQNQGTNTLNAAGLYPQMVQQPANQALGFGQSAANLLQGGYSTLINDGSTQYGVLTGQA